MTEGKQSRFGGMAWVNRVRLRAAIFVIGIPLAVFGAISLGPAWLTLPLVGVAVAAVTMTVGRLTQRIDRGLCWTCGASLREVEAHEHGKVCPECGSLNQHNPAALADAESDAHPAARPRDRSSRA